MNEPGATKDALDDALADDLRQTQAKARSLVARPAMSEDAGRFYTALFSGLTVMGVIVGGLITLIEYREKKQTDKSTIAVQERNADIQARSPFLAKELEYCLAISAKAAAVAYADAANDLTKKQTALVEFEELSQGPLTIVEDENVARHTADFEQCSKLNDCKKDLVALAANLGYSCRRLISKDFNANLAALPDRAVEKTAKAGPLPVQVANRIVTFAVSGSFEQGYAFASVSTVQIDLETGLAVSAKIQIAGTGELFTGAPVYNTDRMWQWQNQGSLGGSLDFQDQTRTFKNYSGGLLLTRSAYWTPSLGHIVSSPDTTFNRVASPQPNQ